MVPYDCLDPKADSGRVSMPSDGRRGRRGDSAAVAGAFPFDLMRSLSTAFGLLGLAICLLTSAADLDSDMVLRRRPSRPVPIGRDERGRVRELRDRVGNWRKEGSFKTVDTITARVTEVGYVFTSLKYVQKEK